MATDDLTLGNLIQSAVARGTYSLRVSMPGIITAYDPAKRRASVRPAIRDGELIEGERQVTDVAVLEDVPVVAVGSAGQRIKFPIAVGHECLLMFCSSSIARWKRRGGVVDPGDDRRHNISDVVAFTGLQNFADADDADAFIEFTEGGLILAGGNNPLVTLDEHNNHTHPAPGGATSTPSVPAVGTPRLRG